MSDHYLTALNLVRRYNISTIALRKAVIDGDFPMPYEWGHVASDGLSKWTADSIREFERHLLDWSDDQEMPVCLSYIKNRWTGEETYDPSAPLPDWLRLSIPDGGFNLDSWRAGEWKPKNE